MTEVLGLVKYDAMIHAIEIAHAVDEVKDIRDKAQALEKYAAQARNFDAEQRAARIRINAELRAGELLSKMQKGRGIGGRKTKEGKRARPSNGAQTLDDLGISKDQSSRWQKLAENPKAVRDYLRDEETVPTTAGALAAVHPAKKEKLPLPVSEDVLWLWGRLGEMRRLDAKVIANGCNERFRREIGEHLAVVIPFLTQLETLL